MLIYATRPRSALVAACRIAEIKVGSPECLWAQTRQDAGCTEDEFFKYFADVSSGTALKLSDVSSIENIPLCELRRRFQWRPPISWCGVPSDSKLLAILEQGR
jgi:predicted transcriptional regulator